MVFKNGTLLPLKGTFVTEGTYPPGSMWATLPVPSDWLGPRCLPGPNDTASTPNACEPWEHHNVDGPCKPCPGTPGSDCSRCDNGPKASFAAPCPTCEGVDWNGNAVKDMVKVPANLPAGDYVLGYR